MYAGKQAEKGEKERSNAVEIIKKANHLLGKIEGYIIAYSVILMAVLLISNVCARVILGTSLNFTEEICSALLITVTYIGISYTLRHSTHVEMSAIIDFLPKKSNKIIRICTQLITAVILIGVGCICVKYVISIKALGRVTPSLQMPTWIALSPLPVGMFLGGLQSFLAALFNLTGKNVTYLGSESIAGEKKETSFTLVENPVLEGDNK